MVEPPVLSDITKTAFALASSGSQRGKDGNSSLNNAAVAFEAKLYEDSVPSTEILNKLAFVAIDEVGDTDLWVLASTGTVSSQTVNNAKTFCEKIGIQILVADWQSSGIPTLACLIAMAPAVAAHFIAHKTKKTEAAISAFLQDVHDHPQFADRCLELRRIIEQPSLGPAYAIKRNEAWLADAFGNTSHARIVFGQPLAPADPTTRGVLDRKDLREQLASTVFGKPDGSTTAILGPDGNGKSWLFAQAWLNQPCRPLVAILIPEDIPENVSKEGLEQLLISKLILQTKDSASPVTTRRWQRHVARWRTQKNPDLPKLVVFLDGINQRETASWTRVIDIYGEMLSEVGGKLVFSSRSFFYADHVKNRLVSRVVSLDVPEWSTEELDQLLHDRGTSISRLNPAVARSLRNPRIFAVALQLLGSAEVEKFQELSVSRLLFEHIRLGGSQATGEASSLIFVRGVREHADTIISRLKQTKPDDLFVFDTVPGSAISIPERFAATAAGRFFEPFPDDHTRYILKDDGLSLALGLSIVEQARCALRNGRSINEELSRLLDPIAALDKTADILLAGLLVSILQENPSEVVISVLVRFFLALQNLDAGMYGEFQALARREPSAFLKALENSILADRTSSNLSWLNQALTDNRKVPNCQASIISYSRRWLSLYSLAPSRLVMSRPGDKDQDHAAEIAARNSKLRMEVDGLSPAEKKLVESLILEERGDYSHLNKIAFAFLAGTSLQSFGTEFLKWSLASALNGGFSDAGDQFAHLIRFNREDWSETRKAILDAASVLRAPSISRTGQWALVYLLRATGSSEDAKEAEEMVERLTIDREKFKGWRSVENYCTTDPCDPSSLRPDNISHTVIQFAALDVSKLRKQLGRGSEEHFFQMALTGLARFEPDAALETIQRFAKDSLLRPNEEFRFAAFGLECHAAALDQAVAREFSSRASGIAEQALAHGDKHNELLVAAQYSLSIAFPHMSGDEQLEALLTHPPLNGLLTLLLRLCRKCEPQRLERALQNAFQADDVIAEVRLLAFAEYSGTALSPGTKLVVAALATSQNNWVRLCALALIAQSADADLIKVVLDSGWSASSLDQWENEPEVRAGSHILVLAAELGLITIDACMERISIDAYSRLVNKLGEEAAARVAARVDAAVRKSMAYRVSVSLPDIEQRFDDGEAQPHLSIHDRRDQHESPLAAFKRESEVGDAWYDRQKLNREATEKFQRELTDAGAELILGAVTVELVTQLSKWQLPVVRGWCDLFLALDEDAVPCVYNFASLVAQVVSKVDPEIGASAFSRMHSASPYVRVTFGKAHIPLDSMSVWLSGEGDALDKLRFARLDMASSDHALALEVLAAIRAGRQEQLRRYVMERLPRPEPSIVARALMVVGLSEPSEWATETLSEFESAHGFLGGAYEAAEYAMDRCIWARHWAGKMSKAQSEIELWRFGTLLAKVVDGRFHSDEIYGDGSNELIDRFGPTFNAVLRRRTEKWKSKRESKLFGMRAPEQCFLA